MAFNLNVAAAPIGQIEASIGTVYLYQANEGARAQFTKLASETTENRAKEILCDITSQELRKTFRDKIRPLGSDAFSSLTEQELTALAELFRKRCDRNRVMPDKPFPEIDPKTDGESALAFFDRVLASDIQAQKEYDREQSKKIMDMVNSSAEKVLEGLNASSVQLAKSLNQYDVLKNSTVEFMPLNDHIGDMSRRINKERQADRDLARMSAEMTANSTRSLKELVDASSSFLLRFDDRDIKSDLQINSQIKIALISLGLSIALSGVGVWFSAKSFYQDQSKGASDDAAASISAERDKRIDEILSQQVKTLESLHSQNQRLETMLKSQKKL